MSQTLNPQWMDHMWDEDTFTWLESLDPDSFHEVMFLSMEYFADRDISNFSPKMFLSEETVVRLLRGKNPNWEPIPAEGVEEDILFDLLLEAKKTTPLLYSLSGLLLGVDFTPDRAEDFVSAFVLPNLHPKRQSKFWGADSDLIASLLNHPQIPVEIIERAASLFLATYETASGRRRSPYRTASHRMWLSMLDRGLSEQAMGRLADRLIQSLEDEKQELDGSAWLELLAALTQRPDFPQSWVEKHHAGESPLPILHRSVPQAGFSEAFPITYRGFLSLEGNDLLDLTGNVVNSADDVPVKWMRPEEVSDEEAFELGRKAVLRIPGGEGEVHFAGWYIHRLREQMEAPDVPLEWLLLTEVE